MCRGHRRRRRRRKRCLRGPRRTRRPGLAAQKHFAAPLERLRLLLQPWWLLGN